MKRKESSRHNLLFWQEREWWFPLVENALNPSPKQLLLGLGCVGEYSIHAYLINQCPNDYSHKNWHYLQITIEKTQRLSPVRVSETCWHQMVVKAYFRRQGVHCLCFNVNIWFISTGLLQVRASLKGIQCTFQAWFPTGTFGVSVRPSLPPAFPGFPGRLTKPLLRPALMGLQSPEPPRVVPNSELYVWALAHDNRDNNEMTLVLEEPILPNIHS